MRMGTRNAAGARITATAAPRTQTPTKYAASDSRDQPAIMSRRVGMRTRSATSPRSRTVVVDIGPMVRGHRLRCGPMSLGHLISAGLGRLTAWITRWGGVLPLLAAEFILWTGFGALLPVMPLYFTEHGVDIAYLGVVIAAWPAARLFPEPVFGSLADRTARVPLMVVGLLVAAASVGAMVLWASPIAFVVLRAASGLGTAIYDPAARGYLNDAAPEGRRGEVFGLYSSAQMGGILFGPAIGGIGTSIVGSFSFVLLLSALTTVLAAVAVGLRVREQPRTGLEGPRRERQGAPGSALAEFPPEMAGSREERPRGAWSPTSLRNRFIAAAILVNLAGYFGGGLYETIWALFVVDRGGSVELVGLTFAIFGLVTILLSPYGD